VVTLRKVRTSALHSLAIGCRYSAFSTIAAFGIVRQRREMRAAGN
jgi:hypothetical protein